MSCEGNRHKFFLHAASLPGCGLTAEALEALYQASRHKPTAAAEAAAAEAKTRRVFAMIQAMGLHPPTHSADGLPKIESRLGYAAVYDCLKNNGLLAALQQAAAQAGPVLGLDGRDAEGFDRWGYNRDGFDRLGYDREGFDDRGNDRKGFNRYGFDRNGYDRQGFDGRGFNRQGFDRHGFNVLGYNKKKLDADGYDENGYKDGYDRAGYNAEGRDRDGNLHPFFTTAGADGLFLDGRDAEGFDPEGYDLNGFDRFGFDRDGYNAHNFDRRGLDREGRDHRGGDAEGYNRSGFQHQIRRDRYGYDEEGFDPQGYSCTGYDRNGLDRNGQLRQRPDKRGKLLPCKFNKSGWDTDGCDRWGFHRKTGLTLPNEHGLCRNVWGWIYDETTQECYDPLDATKRVKHAYGWYWDRSSGRVIAPKRYVAPSTPPGPPPVTPKAPMRREEFEATLPEYYGSGVRARLFDEALHPDSRMAQRWQKSGRALADPLACHNGVLLRCPHCGQFTGGGPHTCPHFDGKKAEVQRSGVVFASYWRSQEVLHDPRPALSDYDPEYPHGYNRAGVDRDGFDRRGYNARGFSRQGYSADGFDVLGYDRDGFDREGYNNAGYNRPGEKRARTLASLGSLLEPGQDLLANQDLAALYSQIATGLVGQPRRVVLREGGGFGTDMRGTITADPYPLGREADPRHNLVVTRAGIHHELGHELFTPPEVWAQVLEVAQGKQSLQGLGEAGAKMLPRFFNIVEDGRMERRLAGGYAGVAEVLAASCRLEPRWHEQVGEEVPAGEQVFWALLYTSLPFYRLREEVRAGMTPQAGALYDELAPIVRQAVLGDAETALAAAIHLARRFEQEGLTDLPPQEYSPPVQPPPGTQPRQGQPGSAGQAAGEDEKGREKAEQPQGAGRKRGKQEQEPAGEGRSAGKQEEEEKARQGMGSSAGGGEEDSGNEQGTGEQEAAGQGSSEQPGQRGSAGGLGDPGQRFTDADLEAVVRSVERQAAAAIESGVRRRSRKDTIGRPLHRPLSERSSTSQRYFSPEGAVEETHVDLPRADPAQARELEKRRPAHKAVAASLARQLRAIREQTEQTLRRQSEGRLDRHQLVGAVKGITDVHTRTRQMPHTSFAVSLAVDLSGSMDSPRLSGALYDATMTLGDTFDLLEMPYEVRGFGSSDAQFKAMDDPGFAPERAACLTTLDLGGTLGARTTGLAASALLARDEKNRLVVLLSDGEMGDHDRTTRTLQQARRDGIVTFGLFLGSGANPQRMDDLYGQGNWAEIQRLDEMPAEVGRRLASLFKRLRK